MKNKGPTDQLDAYLEKLIEEEKSEYTLKKYTKDLQLFFSYLKDSHIDKSVVIAYKEKLKTEYSVSSVNSMISAVNSYLRFIGRSDCCVKQLKLQRMVYCPESRELTKEDYRALVSAASMKKKERLALMIECICATGIRIGELRYITVDAVMSGEAQVYCKGKERKVFIISPLRAKLLDYLKKNRIETGPIFVTRGGKAVDRSNVWREMKGLCESAGISAEKIFPHNLRHLFAREFYALDKDIVKLADVLGHSSINTTRIYVVSSGREHRIYLESMKLIE